MSRKGRNIFIGMCALLFVSGVCFCIRLAQSGINPVSVLFEDNGFSVSTDMNPAKMSPAKKLLQTRNSRSVAVLVVEGVIEEAGKTYNQKMMCDTITELGESSQNQGILLLISSPGGNVYQTDEVYTALLDYKEKTGRPVWAYLGSMAASGGYYIACAADKIYANRNTLTGSIGVICGQSVDMTGLFDRLGIKISTIHSGRNKTMLNPDTPVTEEHIAIMQAISDECYEQFVGIVSESRGLPVDEVKRLADGRIYTARQAAAVKLIDKIAGYEETKKAMQEEFPQLATVPFEEYRYEYKLSFESFFSSARSILSGGAVAVPDFVSEKIGRLQFFPAYYAPGFD